MVEYTDREWATLTAHATELGDQHGVTAAGWYEIPDVTAAKRVLDGIDACDSEVMDTFPCNPLSGEWADSYGIADLLSEVGAEEDSDDGGLASNFETAYSQAVEREIGRLASDMVQADVVINREYIAVVDKHFQDMLAANAAHPYVHEDYERHKRMAYAALVLLTDGDQKYADALADAFHDSNESMEYYLREFTRHTLLSLAHIEDN